VSSMSRLLTACAASTLIAALAGCPPSYVNKDGVYKDALLLPGVKAHPDKDGLDAGKGDVSDWKYVEPSSDGKGSLLLHMGDKFSGKNRHGVSSGKVTVKDANATTLGEKQIVSGKANYTLEFPVKKGERIFILVEAMKGKAPYQLTFEVKADCGECADDEICKDGQCQEPIKPPPAVECDPECRRGRFCLKGRPDREPRCVKIREKNSLCGGECKRIFDVTRKFIKINYGGNKKQLSSRMDRFNTLRRSGQPGCSNQCEAGALDLSCLSGISNARKIPTCKVPCGGECKRGFRCDEDSDTCVRSGGKCKSCKGVTCPDGKKCRCGRCVKKKEPPKPACDPPCKGGKTCNKKTGKCEVRLGPIGCRIIQALPAGSKTNLVLSRGKAHKVAVGDKGSIPGVGTFTIRKVFPNRSKAVINKPNSALAGKKKCSINRKKWKP